LVLAGFLVAHLIGCAGSAVPSEPAREPGAKAPAPSRGESGGTSAPASNASALTYEEALAIATANHYPTGHLTDAELEAPMRNAAWLPKCGVPASTKVAVKVAIWKGRVLGVSVSTSPPDDALATCLAGAARRLEWPSESEPSFYSFVTTY
jgi:hypothetical protein